MSVSQALTLTQKSQSVVNNYSIVRLLWTSTQSGDSFNNYTKTAHYYISKNGGAEEKVAVSYTLPKNSTRTIVDTEIVVPHNSNGTGSIKVRTVMDTGISAGTVEQTKTLTLTTIPRQSSLSVAAGTLGVSQNLTVTKQADSFTHSLTYKCGTASGTICEKSSSKSIAWTPPIELAEQAPSSNSVSVTFTITTYNGNTAIGSSSVSAVFAIPYTNTYIPVLMPTVSDAMGYASKYGAYVQGQSKLKVDIETYGAYGAWITSVKTVFEGVTYTTQDVTTNVIVNSGTLPIKITVTDSRGRTTESTAQITVLPYAYPKITALTATRCDSSGNADSSGSYLLAKFTATVSDLNGKNNSKFYIGYKKTTDESHAAVELTNYGGQYSVSGSYVIPAEPAYSHTVICTVLDDFKTTTVVTTGSSVKKVWSMLKKAGDIVGIAFGKIAELEGVFDIAWQARFSGGILHSVLATRTDLNTLLTPTTFMLLSANEYTNAPENGIGAFLEIVGIKDTSIIQRYSVFDRANPRVYERTYYSSVGWGDWLCVRGDFVVEQGVNNGWTYRKWNSGLAECWKIHEFSTTINTAFGSLYCGNATQRQNYPFTFVEKPVETVTLQSGSTQAFLYAEASGYGVNGVGASARYNVFRPGAMTTSQTFYLSFYVTGKWK